MKRTRRLIAFAVLISCHSASLCQPVMQSVKLYEVYCDTAPQHLCFTTGDIGF